MSSFQNRKIFVQKQFSLNIKLCEQNAHSWNECEIERETGQWSLDYMYLLFVSAIFSNEGIRMGKWIVSLSFLSSQLQGRQLATVVLWKTNCQLTPGEFPLNYCGGLHRKPSWFLINLALHVFEHNYDDYNYSEISF